jgi:hypothetical protein
MSEIITIKCKSPTIETGIYHNLINIKTNDIAFIPAGYALTTVEIQSNQVVPVGVISVVVRDIVDGVTVNCNFVDLGQCLWMGSKPSHLVSFNTNKNIEIITTGPIINNPIFDIFVKYCFIPIGERKY